MFGLSRSVRKAEIINEDSAQPIFSIQFADLHSKVFRRMSIRPLFALVGCGIFLSLPTAIAQDATAGSPSMFSHEAGRRGAIVDPSESLMGSRMRGRETTERPEGEREEIETDRDSFTPSTTLAPHGRLIVESAYSFLDNRGFKETHSFPEMILRYGLSERIELRLGWNMEVGGGGSEVSGSAGEGTLFDHEDNVENEHNAFYGAKFRLTDQDRRLPRSILILQGYTPTGGSEGVSTATQLFATYAAGWEFANQWRVDGAMRYGYDSERGDRFNDWAPSVVLRVPIGEKLAMHAEYFGIFTTGRERNANRQFFSPGLHTLVTPDLEIGFRLGWGLNDQSTRFFVNAGVGWQF
jgi:hypothetical protein